MLDLLSKLSLISKNFKAPVAKSSYRQINSTDSLSPNGLIPPGGKKVNIRDVISPSQQT